MNDEYIELVKQMHTAESHFDNADAEYIEAACYELLAAESALDALKKTIDEIEQKGEMKQ